MMRSDCCFKINLTGGIMASGKLLNITEALAQVGVEQVRFGLRQEMFVDVHQEKKLPVAEALSKYQLDYQIDDYPYPNIVSSYMIDGLTTGDEWLKEGIYRDIFDQFDYKPKLKINIVHQNQTFVPFFSGNINWIASANQNFWHLYIRYPQTNILFSPNEIFYTNHIISISKLAEEFLSQANRASFEHAQEVGKRLMSFIKRKTQYVSVLVEQDLNLPSPQLLYYEGINQYGNKLWLGIYRRDEYFSVPFLQDIARLCMHTKVGQIYTTTWKSIMVKNIEYEHRVLWNDILNKHKINVRHASNELNWQVEDDSEEALNIKKNIIRQFNEEDVRTFGLSFAVQTSPQSELFGSVLIKKQYQRTPNHQYPLDVFDIFYTKDFNPNVREFQLYQQEVTPENLSDVLIRLCSEYYSKIGQTKDKLAITAVEEVTTPTNFNIQKTEWVYECPDCLTLYEPTLGDALQQIPANTSYEDLPETYCCGVCGTPKTFFQKLDKRLFLPSTI